jgi:hypothetical protein
LVLGLSIELSNIEELMEERQGRLINIEKSGANTAAIKPYNKANNKRI